MRLKITIVAEIEVDPRNYLPLSNEDTVIKTEVSNIILSKVLAPFWNYLTRYLYVYRKSIAVTYLK